MAVAQNPWVTAPAQVETPTPLVEHRRPDPRTGPPAPQRGVPVPDAERLLATREYSTPAELWVVGVHGGSGESTLAGLVPGWKAAAHAWPSIAESAPARVLLTARSSARGLLAAQAAATQWASGATPEVDLLGLVVVADVPGRQLPKPLRDLQRVVAGGVPRCWSVPWVESWRLGDEPALTAAPKAVQRLVDDLRLLLKPGASGTNH